MNKENMELDLKKMLYNFLKKWYIVIAVMIIMAVLGNIFYIYQKNTEKEKNIKRCEESLTKKEQLEVDYAHEKYDIYDEQYEEKNAYFNNSMRMKIDSENEYVYTSQYYIQTADGNAENIASTFEKGIENQDLYDAVEKALKGKVKSQYVSELIEIRKVTSTDNLSLESANNRLLNIKIIGQNEEDCISIFNEIKKRMSSIYSETQQIYGSYNMMEVFIDGAVKDDASLREEQKSLQDELVLIKKNMYEVTKSLTTVQKEYYNAKYTLEESVEKSDISIKYIILGLGVGFVLCLIISAAKYILQKRLRSFSELKQGWNLTLLGNPIALKQKKSVDGFFDSRLNNNMPYKPYDEQINRIVSEILMLLKKDGVHSIIVTGVADTDDAGNCIRDIVNELCKNNINAKACKSIVKDTASLVQIENADYIIIVEQIMKTMYADIDKEIELCHRADKNILGAVVIAD